jgi:hypothetical protein
VAGKHRIRVYAADYRRRGRPWWHWYVYCTGCGWEPNEPIIWPGGDTRFARPTQAESLALGLAHLEGIKRARMAEQSDG